MGRCLAIFAVLAVLSAPGVGISAPCSVLDKDCSPEPCRTANPLCPEGQVCLIAVDNPPCEVLDESCNQNGYCATISQARCEGHEGCQGNEVCYDKGMPLCTDDAPDEDGPPCETPTSLPQGQCAPPTECTEDAHCREGFVCERFRVLLGMSRTEIGVCAPLEQVCNQPSDCPEGWDCLDASAERLCVPEDHDLVCGDGGCELLRRAAAMALSSPQAAPAPMEMRPPMPEAEKSAGGCQASAGGSPLRGLWVVLGLLIALSATRRGR